MSLDLGIAVFARTPGSGGKTRLAETWGRTRTDTFYNHCLRCAADWLIHRQDRSACYWALTGPGPRDASCWQGLPLLDQGDGGLGERMAHIAGLLHAHHGCWCLTGTDIPQMGLPAELGLQERLADSDFVFAPAADGGFWLAAGRLPLPQQVWTEVVYSRPDTLTRLLAAVRGEMANPVIDSSLPILHDIDEQKDLVPLLQALETRSAHLTLAQHDLLQWLRSEEPPAD